MKTIYITPETEEIEIIMESHLNETSPKTLKINSEKASVNSDGYYDSLSRESDWDE